MRYFEDEISGIDGSTATFVGYCLDNSSEIDPNRKRPSVLVIPGGGYEMTSDREAEPIAMQFLAASTCFLPMTVRGLPIFSGSPVRALTSGSPAVTLPPILRLPPATTCSRHMVTMRMRCARTA